MPEQLYIHIGMHKTGSSYLQSVMESARRHLLDAGFYCPQDPRERDGSAGTSFHGNGISAVLALERDAPGEISALLEEYAARAAAEGASSVVLSAEGLFHALARPGSMARFEAAADEAGFSAVHGLLFLRDPMDHLLSTYKHRAKRGRHGDFEAWLWHDYETLGLLRTFLDEAEGSGIQWRCRKYARASGYMAEAMFQAWLGVPVPPYVGRDRVNESLQLVEIDAVRWAERLRPGSGAFVRDALLTLPASERHESRNLVDRARGVAAPFLIEHQETLERANAWLPESERLETTVAAPRVGAEVHETGDLAITMSASQLQAVLRGIDRFHALGAVGRLLRRAGRSARHRYGSLAARFTLRLSSRPLRQSAR